MVLTAKNRSDKNQKRMDFYALMKEALWEAQKALSIGEVPVGAVVADTGGKILARAHNRPISLNDPTAHAEILALRQAAASCGNYRLEGATLVVTIEPCPMCMGAALHARISRLVFGASDPKWGAAGSLFDLANDACLNHRIEVIGGVMDASCREKLQDFFRGRRGRVQGQGEVPKWS